MSWAKLDDGVLDHPKVAGTGLLGFAWYAAGLVYCNRNLTDGFIPYGIARQLAPLVHTAPDGTICRVAITSGLQGCDGDELAERLVAALVAARLWHEVPGGYQVHDFSDHNPTRAEVLERRERLRAVRSEAGHRGAARRWQNGKPDGKRDGKPLATRLTNGQQTDGPVPVPVPVPVPEPQKEESAYALSSPRGDARAVCRQLFDLWNRTVTALPKVTELTDERARKAATRLHKRPDLAWWERAIRACDGSSFCQGEGGGWVCTFDWLIRNGTNAVKAVEGQYARNGGPRRTPTEPHYPDLTAEVEAQMGPAREAWAADRAKARG